MYASVTVGHAPTEIRTTRRVGRGEDRHTVRVRTGRSTARRHAINNSLEGA